MNACMAASCLLESEVFHIESTTLLDAEDELSDTRLGDSFNTLYTSCKRLPANKLLQK